MQFEIKYFRSIHNEASLKVTIIRYGYIFLAFNLNKKIMIYNRFINSHTYISHNL